MNYEELQRVTGGTLCVQELITTYMLIAEGGYLEN